MDSPDQIHMDEEAPDPASISQHDDVDQEDATEETSVVRQRQPRRRGRHAKDPLGQSIQFKCQRLEDLEAKLREYLANPSADPEHTTLEFSFPVTAAFMVSAREPIGPLLPDKKIPYLYSAFNKTAISVIDALQNITDPKEQMLMQKRISKTLVEACQEADGFRYSFNNHWLSREDQASRFSYYCNDSTLNKGRAANEGVDKIRNGVKVRKEVFECHGLIWIKFSATKMTLELHYKHVPLHKTYEERAPAPRKDSKRMKLLQIFHPDRIPKPKEKKRKATPPPKPPSKRKRRATEPIIQTDSAVPQAARENSLQPLFDFLGSASQLEEERHPTAVPDAQGDIIVEHSGPAPVVTFDDGPGQTRDVAATTATIRKKPRKAMLPGMMSGYLSGEDITWGRKSDSRPPRFGPHVTPNETPQNTQPHIPAPPVQASQDTNQMQSTSNAQTELELLKARLQDAEQKIRDLEAEKQRAAAPIPYTGPPPQFPTMPNQGYPHPYFPPPQYPYPPPQWQYPPPQHPPGPHPPPSPQSHGPPPQQYHGTPPQQPYGSPPTQQHYGPPPQHAPMHPMPAQGPSISPAPIQPNTPVSGPPPHPRPTSTTQISPAQARTPTYGFVPHPVGSSGQPNRPVSQPPSTPQPGSVSTQGQVQTASH